MASYNNYSQRDRAVKSADAFNSPEDIETTKVNQNTIKKFNDVKDKWKEYCSYFRAYP